MTENDPHIGITHARKLMQDERPIKRLSGIGIFYGASDLYQSLPKLGKFVVRGILAAIARRDGVKDAYARITNSAKIGEMTANGTIVRGSEIVTREKIQSPKK